MKEQISLIIPTVNAVDELDLALSSLQKNSDLSVDIIVLVDPDISTGKIKQAILRVCAKHGIKPILNDTNLGPYGSWNKGAGIASSKWLVFATDDQYFAPHWDSNLLKAWCPKRLVAGRLVEPGIIPVYKTNIRQDFGINPSEFDEKGFIAWCNARKDTGFVPDGFFIPLLIARSEFESLGPFGTTGQFGTSSAKSNDYLFVQNALKRGFHFGTASDSYSYHFQASSWKKKNLNPNIAAVVLTHNEEKDLGNCLKSLSWVNDVYVIDSGSRDKTVDIAKRFKAKVLKHKFDNFAGSRNFALTCVKSYDWVLMVDADEVVEPTLATELKSFAKDIYLDGVSIPRKNFIFGKWIEHSDWYPDYRLVFFRPKIVKYSGDVHERAGFIKGNGTVAVANSSLLHHNYDTVREFVLKNLVDYPMQYAKELESSGVKFSPLDLLSKPIGEFMRRFFLTEGYKDGMYGLILSALMATQTLVAYCYLWEIQGKQSRLTAEETQSLFRSLRSKSSELTYWLTTLAITSSRGAKRFIHSLRRKTISITKGL